MRKPIYIIETMWLHPQKIKDINKYEAIGFVEYREEAEHFCKNGGVYILDDGVSYLKEIPKFRYKEIDHINRVEYLTNKYGKNEGYHKEAKC